MCPVLRIKPGGDIPSFRSLYTCLFSRTLWFSYHPLQSAFPTLYYLGVSCIVSAIGQIVMIISTFCRSRGHMWRAWEFSWEETSVSSNSIS